MLSPSRWKRIGLRACWALSLWKSSGVIREEQVESLVNLCEAEDLIIQQTPHLKNEIEVPRVGEEWLLLFVAVD